MFRLRDAEEMLGCSSTKVLALANRLPVTPHDQPRVARYFSIADLTFLLMAELLIRDGFHRNEATVAVSAMAPELEPMMLDEDREAWLIVWSDASAEGGISHQLAYSKSDALDVIFQHNKPTILTVRKLFEEAMFIVLAAKVASGKEGNVDG